MDIVERLEQEYQQYGNPMLKGAAEEIRKLRGRTSNCTRPPTTLSPSDRQLSQLLARTLALQSAREIVAQYLRIMEMMQFQKSIETARHVLFQIDLALKG